MNIEDAIRANTDALVAQTKVLTALLEVQSTKGCCSRTEDKPVKAKAVKTEAPVVDQTVQSAHPTRMGMSAPVVAALTAAQTAEAVKIVEAEQKKREDAVKLVAEVIAPAPVVVAEPEDEDDGLGIEVAAATSYPALTKDAARAAIMPYLPAQSGIAKATFTTMGIGNFKDVTDQTAGEFVVRFKDALTAAGVTLLA